MAERVVVLECFAVEELKELTHELIEEEEEEEREREDTELLCESVSITL